MNEFAGRLSAFFAERWTSLLYPALLFLAVAVAGWLARRAIFAALHRWAGRTTWKIDDVIIGSLQAPARLWVIILAVYAAMEYSQLPEPATVWARKILLVLWIVSITLALGKLGGRMVRTYGHRFEGALPVSTLTEVLVSIVAGLIGLLTLLNAFDVPITPLLTTLGVGGLAVALALQDTLANFFAGFYISLAGQIRVGDFIELEAGQKGYVADIGWRSVTLRHRNDNLIVIPNNKLSQAIVTNYHLPQVPIALVIIVSTSYESDPDHVERVILDVYHKAIEELPILCAEPAPSVRLLAFGASSLDFTVTVRVREYEVQFLAQHELRKRLVKRFREEGIVIPYPVRTLEFKNRPPQ